MHIKKRNVNPLAILFLFTVVLSSISGIVGVTASEPQPGENVEEESKPSDRVKWWSPYWHFRKTITVDANDYSRRWGRVISYQVGLASFASLDVNSIRVVDGQTEIPSQYDPGTDIVMFVVNETLGPDEMKDYFIYYDNTTCTKEVPDYGYAYIQEYISTLQSYEDYKDGRDAAQSEYFANFQIQEVGGAHVLRGETVVQYPDGNWYYLNGTQADHYIEGDGTFFWYDGKEVYADDQGNWYYKDGSRIVGALYFDDGEYYWYLDPNTTYKVVPDGSGGWRFAWDPTYPEGGPDYDLIIVNPINDYYYTVLLSLILGNPLFIPSVVYRDQITGIWYYYNNSVMEGWYDPVDREFYYNGNYIYQESDGDWVYDTAEGTIGFASVVDDLYMYQDQQVFLDDGGTPSDPTDDVWRWVQDGTEVIGYAYKDEATGDWMVYVGKILEELDLIDGTLWYEDEFIVYNEVDGTWEFLSGSDVLGSVDENNKVYMMGDNVVYYNNADDTWYYEDGTVVEGTVTYDSLTGVYTLFYNGIEHAIYESEGIVYYWDGTGWTTYGPVDIDDLEFYMGSEWFDNFQDECIDDIITNDPLFKTIESSSTWNIVIKSDSGTYTNVLTNKIWRDVPDTEISVSSNAPYSCMAYGSSLFNLNSTITIGGVEYGAGNISDYIDDMVYDFNSLGIDIDSDVQNFLDGNDITPDFSLASGTVILSECDPIDVQELDWDDDAHDMSGIYSTGKTYGAGEKLEVIPVLIHSRYVGVYDILEQSGYALTTSDDLLINNVLVEAWKETMDEGVYYYVNVSFNTLNWWHTAGALPVHSNCPDDLTIKMVLLDGTGDADPQTTIADALGDIPNVIVTTKNTQQSVPIKIGTIFAPLKVQSGNDCPIEVGIEGETVGTVKYRIGSDPTLYDFDTVEPFYINNAIVRHWGLRANTTIVFSTTGTIKLTVVVTDTNGLKVITKSTNITVSTRASDIFTWISVLFATIAGLLGFALIAGKKKGARNPAEVASKCIDGKCEL